MTDANGAVGTLKEGVETVEVIDGAVGGNGAAAAAVVFVVAVDAGGGDSERLVGNGGWSIGGDAMMTNRSTRWR